MICLCQSEILVCEAAKDWFGLCQLNLFDGRLGERATIRSEEYAAAHLAAFLLSAAGGRPPEGMLECGRGKGQLIYLK